MSHYQVTFLRHGESVGNRDGFIQGRADFPLSETGIQQVRELANEWQKAGKQFDAIITSPLKRARQTAEIVAEKLGGEMIEDILWQERSRGKFEGLPKSEAYSDGQRLDLASRHMQPGETGESTAQLSIRAGYAIQSLLSRPVGNYLVVSHGAILNAVLRALHGVHSVSTLQGTYFSLLNTGYADYEFNTERNQWLMRSLTPPGKRGQVYNPNADLHRFVFLRHGQSEGNVQRIFQGQLETPLTELGRAQALEAGKSLKDAGYQFRAVIASPLERALDTANLINEKFSAPITTDDRLKEVHNGEMAGMNLDQINNRFPEGVRPDQINPYVPIGESGESWFELYLRAAEVVDDLLKNPPGEYLVVSHGACLNNVVQSILGTMVVPRGRPGWMLFGNTTFADLSYSIEKNRWEFLGFTSYVEH